MRFLMIDRIDHFIPNEQLHATFAVPRTLHFPVGRPDGPGPSASLLLEVLAQGGGWLIKASREFEVLAVMAVIRGFRYYRMMPSSGLLSVKVQMGSCSNRLLSVSGELFTQAGEVLAAARAISYTLVPVEKGGFDWGRQVWSVLAGGRELGIVEDKR